MKPLSILLILLFATTITKAQQAGKLYITSYNDTGQIGYVCDGQPESYVSVQYGLLNLNPSVPLTIDSIVPSGDPSVFPDQQVIVIPNFVLNDVSVGGNAGFAPTRAGDDTIHETVYYNGQFTATATIIFHARSSPNLALYGHTKTTAYFVDGNGFGDYNLDELTDTMHDQLMPGGNEIYYVGAAPSENGGIYNQPVSLHSCGGATIDSIYEVGDFSEFSFDPFPHLPYSMPSEDSLVFNYVFTPKVVDTTGLRHHYLIFHSTDGHYLTWSFEYKVYPASSVSDVAILNDQIKVFPNPVSDELQVLGGQPGTVHLFDIMGRERMNASDDGTTATLDVSHLDPGTYFLRLGNQSTKVQISR